MEFQDLEDFIDEMKEKLVTFRRELHRRAELAFCETQTAAYLEAELAKMGAEFKTGIAKTGIVGDIIVPKAKRTLLLRADMDALPIQETAYPGGPEPASGGAMHACGHDAHMAILLGTVAVLSRFRDHLSCNIRFLFQPGEEDTGGAEPMIKEGVLTCPRVDAAAALHVMNDLEVGKIRVKPGAVMAAPDDFDLIIRGKGGHGAYPHDCIDPIALACRIIEAFDMISARCATPFAPKVISVCAINGGSFYNVIPDEVHLKGTVRAFDEKVRRELPEKMEAAAAGITSAFGAEYSFDYRFRFPPLLNDEDMAAKLAESAAKAIGKDNVVLGGEPSMAGDDFSYFAKSVPSVYFHLGSRNEKKGAVMALHSSDFRIDEDCLLVGVRVLTQFAMDFGKT